MLGSTMVELSTTHQASSPTSLDVLLQQQQDPVPPPLPSSRDAAAATSLPEEIAPPPQPTSSPPEITPPPQPTSSPPEITPPPQPQPQPTKVPTSSATKAIEDAPAENLEKKHDESKKEPRKRGVRRKDEMRGWLLMVATVFSAMTYQAGLTPPGGFWQDDKSPSLLSANGTGITPSPPSGNGNSITPPPPSRNRPRITPPLPSSNRPRITNRTPPSPTNTYTSSGSATPSYETRHLAGRAILQDTNSKRYGTFSNANSIAFVYSMGAIVLLSSNTLCNMLDGTADLKLVMVINAFIIALAYSAGCGRNGSISRAPLIAMCVIVSAYVADYLYGKIFKRDSILRKFFRRDSKLRKFFRRDSELRKLFRKDNIIGKFLKKDYIIPKTRQFRRLSGEQENVEA
ncbi:hypothetical protein COCNU_scaffold036382G000010 [Cocos nucifera]|nr:hypothetical protein [Cocos nucifera]